MNLQHVIHIVFWDSAHQRASASRAVDVRALDAAMPFDFEHKAQARLAKAKQLTIGIVGFGTFGQFLARRLVQAGHKVPRCLAQRCRHRLCTLSASCFSSLRCYRRTNVGICSFS